MTGTDLEAMEGRIFNRIAELEMRINQRFNRHIRWMIGLAVLLYALVLATILAIALKH